MIFREFRFYKFVILKLLTQFKQNVVFSKIVKPVLRLDAKVRIHQPRFGQQFELSAFPRKFAGVCEDIFCCCRVKCPNLDRQRVRKVFRSKVSEDLSKLLSNNFRSNLNKVEGVLLGLKCSNELKKIDRKFGRGT